MHFPDHLCKLFNIILLHSAPLSKYVIQAHTNQRYSSLLANAFNPPYQIFLLLLCVPFHLQQDSLFKNTPYLISKINITTIRIISFLILHSYLQNNSVQIYATPHSSTSFLPKILPGLSFFDLFYSVTYY